MSEKIYYKKYLKYKTKYFMIKNEQQGGLLDNYFFISSRENIEIMMKENILTEKKILKSNKLNKTVPIYKVIINENTFKLIKENLSETLGMINIDTITQQQNYTYKEIKSRENITEQNIKDTITKFKKYIDNNIDSYILVKNLFIGQMVESSGQISLPNFFYISSKENIETIIKEKKLIEEDIIKLTNLDMSVPIYKVNMNENIIKLVKLPYRLNSKMFIQDKIILQQKITGENVKKTINILQAYLNNCNIDSFVIIEHFLNKQVIEYNVKISGRVFPDGICKPHINYNTFGQVMTNGNVKNAQFTFTGKKEGSSNVDNMEQCITRNFNDNIESMRRSYKECDYDCMDELYEFVKEHCSGYDEL